MIEGRGMSWVSDLPEFQATFCPVVDFMHLEYRHRDRVLVKVTHQAFQLNGLLYQREATQCSGKAHVPTIWVSKQEKPYSGIKARASIKRGVSHA